MIQGLFDFLLIHRGNETLEKEGANLFSELGSLGLKGVDIYDIYKKEEPRKDDGRNQKSQETYLYEKTVNCPVCGKETKIKAVRSNVSKMTKRDSDFMIYYDVVNPMLYEIMYCKVCGYAGLPGDFSSLTGIQRKAVLAKITPSWKSKEYPEIYDVDNAIEQHKLALLNAVVKESKPSGKAILCLKISWLYRLKGDRDQELVFQKQAVQGWELAYENEDFPLYGLDIYSALYLIGELYRRIGDNEKALRYFGMVLSDVKASPKIKEKARDQKELIRKSDV